MKGVRMRRTVALPSDSISPIGTVADMPIHLKHGFCFESHFYLAKALSRWLVLTPDCMAQWRASPEEWIRLALRTRDERRDTHTPMDLRLISLSFMNLSGLNMKGVRLAGELAHVNLTQTNLTGALFDQVTLRSACLNYANMLHLQVSGKLNIIDSSAIGVTFSLVVTVTPSSKVIRFINTSLVMASIDGIQSHHIVFKQCELSHTRVEWDYIDRFTHSHVELAVDDAGDNRHAVI